MILYDQEKIWKETDGWIDSGCLEIYIVMSFDASLRIKGKEL